MQRQGSYGVATGSPARTPGGKPRIGAGGTTASPQVRARIAELRRAKLAASAATSASAGNNKDPDSASLLSTSDGRPSSRTSSFNGSYTETGDDLQSSNGGGAVSPAESDVAVELSMRTLKQEINKAKANGRLNIASRSLPDFPPLVLEELLPRSSIYHPSQAGPPKIFSSLIQKVADVDLSEIESSAEEVQNDESSSLKWWEYQDLTTLKASNNEFTEVPQALAGFDQLQNVDLHANKIASPLPASFGTLGNLTSVNLSHNSLTDWPIELLALVHLQELDLSHNRLKTLWQADWKTHLKIRLKDIKRDAKRLQRGDGQPDNSLDSIASECTAPDASAGEDLWNAFRSSPVKTRAVAYQRTEDTTDYTAIFPRLRSLNLSDNSISAKSLAQVSEFPAGLTSLHLASNAISGSIPLDLLGSLKYLKELTLDDNGLQDDFFTASTAPEQSIFPMLQNLSLRQNSIDSLQYLETSLGSPSIRTVSYTGVDDLSLRKMLQAVGNQEEAQLPLLKINLHGNQLRDELLRRKKVKRAQRENVEANGHASFDSEGTAEQEKAQVRDIVAELQRIEQSLTTRVRNGQLDATSISHLKRLIEPVSAFLDGSNETAMSAKAQTAKQHKEVLQGHIPRQQVSKAPHATTPVKAYAPPIIESSSKARRMRMEQEAAAWAPL